jgi:hypothetical protein
VFDVQNKPNETFVQCVSYKNLDTSYKKGLYLAYNMIGFYLAPLFVMIFCYFKIFRTIAKHSKEKNGSKSLGDSSKFYFDIL